MKYDVIVIGAGFSGLAAALRFSRYHKKVLVLEAHHRPGGLSSWYYRDGRFFETGLHALSSFAPSRDRTAPINRLLRQLGIPREQIGFLPQSGGRVVFTGPVDLAFANDPEVLRAEIAASFPAGIDGFDRFCAHVRETRLEGVFPTGSARELMAVYIKDPLLLAMIIFPLMAYSASSENDLDVFTLLVMFRAIYLEGLFRPRISVREFLRLMIAGIESGGGEVRFRAPVGRIVEKNGRVAGVATVGGDFIASGLVISTVGLPATMRLRGQDKNALADAGRISFFESQYVIDKKAAAGLSGTETVCFYNFSGSGDYFCPPGLTDPRLGCVCLPHRFRGAEIGDEVRVRVTNPANYQAWKDLQPEGYRRRKEKAAQEAARVVEGMIGPFADSALFHDAFTPLTIERFTGRPAGAVYGSPEKIWDGDLGLDGLLLAGTDQGLVGVVGAMISGVNQANRMLMPMRLDELKGE